MRRLPSGLNDIPGGPVISYSGGKREMTPGMVQKVVFPHPTVSEIIKECVFETEQPESE